MYTGKDSKELGQSNFLLIIAELEDLLVHDLHYTEEKDTFLMQVAHDWSKAPLKAGDWDVAVELVLPLWVN